jgi:hypothetical protein
MGWNSKRHKKADFAVLKRNNNETSSHLKQHLT